MPLALAGHSVRGWRPKQPKQFVQVCRDDEMVWIGVVTEAERRGDRVHFECKGPDYLIADMPLPFTPPGAHLASNRAGFELWWRRVLYVFELPDPSLFPALSESLPPGEAEVVARYLSVTGSLAASTVASASSRVTLTPGEDRGKRVEWDFPPADAQAGFASLLRQCDSDNEPASYKRVRELLWQACLRADDALAEKRLASIKAWQQSRRKLRKKSADQLMREALAEREGMSVLAYCDGDAPEVLLRRFNYGDLIHWGETRGAVDVSDDVLIVAGQRRRYLDAALGLAHVYIGFGELARAATTPRDRLLVP